METNRYASEKISKLQAQGNLRQKSRFRKWTPLTIEEFHGFLAIVLNMGIIKVPEIEDYWKTSWVSQIPFFSRIMPRDRFELIFWMLHVSHTEGSTQKRIDKVSMLMNTSSSEVPTLLLSQTRLGSR
ncbi:PiggyBac transposable element-derived protein 4 [Geodia barretti]|uniref:PiggyBac transposable element-derived protein 4 n=1 Tax=Geodia barretti TaxID=519541 RepID=A0AA35RZW4_GEOBA|nr:PiggyBac transposable element-derived protein 4 [Geodia barretti]